MKINLLRAVSFFVLFTLLSSGVYYVREGNLPLEIIINAAVVGSSTAVLLYYWHFRARTRKTK